MAKIYTVIIARTASKKEVSFGQKSESTFTAMCSDVQSAVSGPRHAAGCLIHDKD
jgi:hypothetical protein